MVEKCTFSPTFFISAEAIRNISMLTIAQNKRIDHTYLLAKTDYKKLQCGNQYFKKCGSKTACRENFGHLLVNNSAIPERICDISTLNDVFHAYVDESIVGDRKSIAHGTSECPFNVGTCTFAPMKWTCQPPC
jgi:hypothetical protein